MTEKERERFRQICDRIDAIAREISDLTARRSEINQMIAHLDIERRGLDAEMMQIGK